MSLRIGAISGYGMYGVYPAYGMGTAAAGSTEDGSRVGKAVLNPGEDTKVTPGRKSSPAECETCKNRKYQDGSDENGGKVLQASVAIHTAICPECGTTYVSGGVTSTRIKYTDESNPYQKDMKAQHGDALRGANVDLAV